MKKVFFVAALAIFGLSNAQTVAYKGKGDVKGQLAANFQKGGTGVLAGVDYGLGESFSIGAQRSYLHGVDEIAGVKPDFGDRIDAKVRFNANLGSVLKLPSNIDVYPGLDLGLKNFGGHIGARYFFDKGFGVFSEVQFPFAKYSDKNKLFHNLNNQFNFTIGASFDL
jgi:hypothetical protein